MQINQLGQLHWIVSVVEHGGDALECWNQQVPHAAEMTDGQVVKAVQRRLVQVAAAVVQVSQTLEVPVEKVEMAL